MFENTRFPEGFTVTNAVEFPFDVKFLAKFKGVWSVVEFDWSKIPLYGTTIPGVVLCVTPVCVTVKKEFTSKFEVEPLVATFMK